MPQSSFFFPFSFPLPIFIPICLFVPYLYFPLPYTCKSTHLIPICFFSFTRISTDTCRKPLFFLFFLYTYKSTYSLLINPLSPYTYKPTRTSTRTCFQLPKSAQLLSEREIVLRTILFLRRFAAFGNWKIFFFLGSAEVPVPILVSLPALYL